MLLVVAPGLSLQLSCCQVLLVSPRLVVEGIEESLCLQFLEQLRVLQDGDLAVWVRLGQAIRHKARLHCFGAPQPVCGSGQRPPAESICIITS